MTADFDSRAATWDEDPRRAERARHAADAIDAAVRLHSAMAVLDYGSGTGQLSFALADRVGTLLLADASRGMTEVAQGRIAESGRQGMRAVQLDLLADPTPPERFDLVVSLMALHHVPDVPLLLTRLHDLLNPGGRVALLDLEPDGGAFHDPGFQGHHGFGPEQLARMLTEVGFGGVEVRTALTIEKEVAGEPREFGVFLAVGSRGGAGR